MMSLSFDASDPTLSQMPSLGTHPFDQQYLKSSFYGPACFKMGKVQHNAGHLIVAPVLKMP